MDHQGLYEAYLQVCEQSIGIPIEGSPSNTGAKKTLENLLKSTGNKGKVVLPEPSRPSGLVRQAEEYTIYDQVLDYLLGEGYSIDESNYIMTHVVEQGMPPQEIIGRGIANMLGFDRPNPTQVFAQGLRKVLWPNKPQPLQAPKPPNPPRVVPVGKPPSGQKPPVPEKPNIYRPGATVRATGPTGNFPELERHTSVATRGSGLNPSEVRAQSQKNLGDVARTASTIASLRNLTPLGVAAAVMAPRPTAPGTLDTAPKLPTRPQDVQKGQKWFDFSTPIGPSGRAAQRLKVGPATVGPKLTTAQDFDRAYKTAKEKGGMGSTFSWRGQSYKVS